MKSPISMARQRLRDYARELLRVTFPPQFNDEGHAVPVKPGEPISVEIYRGEIGGKAFEAAQAALTVAEALREESREEVTRLLSGEVAYSAEVAHKAGLADAADRIEAAVLKALS